MALLHLLEKLENEHHFACAIINNIAADQFSTNTTIAISHIFTLAKHPDWMGLSVSLPNLRGHHVQTWESRKHPDSPRAMIALPDIMMLGQVPQALPAAEGGLKVLAQVAAWHGAASFQWFPADHRAQYSRRS